MTLIRETVRFSVSLGQQNPRAAIARGQAWAGGISTWIMSIIAIGPPTGSTDTSTSQVQI